MNHGLGPIADGQEIVGHHARQDRGDDGRRENPPFAVPDRRAWLQFDSLSGASLERVRRTISGAPNLSNASRSASSTDNPAASVLYRVDEVLAASSTIRASSVPTLPELTLESVSRRRPARRHASPSTTAWTARANSRHSPCACQRPLPFRRQLIDAAAAAVDLRPAAGQQSGALEPMQRRIQRAFRKVERSVAASAKLLRNRVSVCGLGLNRGQEQQVQVAFQRLGVHPSRWYTSRSEVSTPKPDADRDPVAVGRRSCAAAMLTGRSSEECPRPAGGLRRGRARVRPPRSRPC